MHYSNTPPPLGAYTNTVTNTSPHNLTSNIPTSTLSIGALNRIVRECIEINFPLCWVVGEISNLTIASSGHAYFTLKDENAQVRCVMFRNRAGLLGWKLANGQHVEARVLVTLYEARGDFQLNVETMRQAGTGNLYERFEKLKALLATEGLFDTKIKRPLPAFPRCIGIVTSLQAAALRDVLATLARRAPHVKIILFPTQVQGDGAGTQIAAAINTAAAHASQHSLETLIVCRGGGSIEDLWAFNDEAVARTIRACPVPVISGIGHETDFTIADFAADLRAPTPTAAAEIVAPERTHLLRQLNELHATLGRQIKRAIEQHFQHIDGLARRLTHPAERLARQHETLRYLAHRLSAANQHQRADAAVSTAKLSQRLLRCHPQSQALRRRTDQIASRLTIAQRSLYTTRAAQLTRLADSLTHLNPLAVLERGYALVENTEGHIVRDALQLEPYANINVYLARGKLGATVISVIGDKDATAPSQKPKT